MGLGITAKIRTAATDTIALSLNLNNFGLTQYTNYDYNSLCILNGKMIGAKRGGIYELSGDTDDGTAIPWKIRTGAINLHKRGALLSFGRLKELILMGRMSGNLIATVETAEGTRYEYNVESISETDDAVRIKVGKGLNSEYIIIEFRNESTETVTIDKIMGYGMKV